MCEFDLLGAVVSLAIDDYKIRKKKIRKKPRETHKQRKERKADQIAIIQNGHTAKKFLFHPDYLEAWIKETGLDYSKPPLNIDAVREKANGIRSYQTH